MNITEIYKKALSDLTDDEIAFVLKQSRRIPGHNNLFSVAGTGFGWAHSVEREQIKRKLIAEGKSTEYIEFDISKEQDKLHRDDPPFKVYQKMMQKIKPAAPSVSFDAAELEHIIEHFSNANDPFVQMIAEKAQKQLALFS